MLICRAIRAGAADAKAHSASLLKNAVSGDVQVERALRSGQLKVKGGHAPTRILPPTTTCSPAPCVLPNVQASEGGQPVEETTVAVTPNNPKNVLTGANDYNCGNSYMGLYASGDGGTTWNTNCMPVEAGQIGCGDPGVGYDLHNTAYAVSIENCGDAAPGPSAIVMAKSTNNGASWNYQPLPGSSATPNPWGVQTRGSADGNTAAPFLSSIFHGENLTGIARSADAGIPATLTWYLAGHNGQPQLHLPVKNMVRLREAQTNENLAGAAPPLSASVAMLTLRTKA